MIAIFDKLEDTNTIEVKKGDTIRLPIDASLLDKCTEYFVKTIKVQTNEKCESEIVEVIDGANIEPFKCTYYGTFKLKVNSFDTTGQKQFAIYLDGWKIGKTFTKKATSIAEYVAKIVKHYSKIKIFNVTAKGNVIEFTQNSDCSYCGLPISIGLGSYNILNQNSPCIKSTYIGTEYVIGKNCYKLDIANIVEGNNITVNGISYYVGENETVEELKLRILGENAMLCVDNTVVPGCNIVLGNRKVNNTNNPKISTNYYYSDASYDYYKISCFDVREGNIFVVNGSEKRVAFGETEQTLNAYFNKNNGFYRVANGSEVNVYAIASNRVISNSNNPTASLSLVSVELSKLKKKYSITICDDIVAGNIYYLGPLIYVAKKGDTAVDVAYNLTGENSSSFLHYGENGVDLICKVENGFERTTENNLADVEMVCNTITCTPKNSLIFSFNPTETGCYKSIITTKAGTEIAYLSTIKVKEELKGELVEFNNTGNSYGIEFDKNEWFSIRMPIFLKDWVMPITETFAESVNGDMVRGLTTLSKQREFLIDNSSFAELEYYAIVLKSENLRIKGEQYQCAGEYAIDKQRSGIADLRQATGTLKSISNLISNQNSCQISC